MFSKVLTTQFRNMDQYSAEGHQKLVYTVPQQTTSDVYTIHLSFEDLPKAQSLKRRAPTPVHQFEATRKPKRARTFFQKDQLELLEKEYDSHNYLEPYRREKLSKILNLSENCLKVWFQNRRKKDSIMAKQIVDGIVSNQAADVAAIAAQLSATSSPQIKSITGRSTSSSKSETPANLTTVDLTASDTRRDVPAVAPSPNGDNNLDKLLDQLDGCSSEAIEAPRLKTVEEILHDIIEVEQTYGANTMTPPVGINCTPSFNNANNDPSYLSSGEIDLLITGTNIDSTRDLNSSHNLQDLIEVEQTYAAKAITSPVGINCTPSYNKVNNDQLITGAKSDATTDLNSSYNLQDLIEVEQTYVTNKMPPSAGINCTPSYNKVNNDLSNLWNHEIDQLITAAISESSTYLNSSDDLNLSFLI